MAGHIASAGSIVCTSGIGAEAPPEVAGCDPGKANVGIPGLRGVSGEDFCVRRGKQLASLLKSWRDNKSARIFKGLRNHRVYFNIIALPKEQFCGGDTWHDCALSGSKGYVKL